MSKPLIQPAPTEPARRHVVSGVTLGLLTASSAFAAAPHLIKDTAMTTQTNAGLDDFDFLFGSWEVSHRQLKRRLAGSDEWLDFTGRTLCRRLTLGLGNMDENWLDTPGGAYGAVTTRYFDPATRRWTIYWIDNRRPTVEPAVAGAFEDGLGTFYAEDRFEGKPIRVRFLWSHITSSSARWEQAFSPDAGATWETNWVMDFRRAPA